MGLSIRSLINLTRQFVLLCSMLVAASVWAQAPETVKIGVLTKESDVDGLRHWSVMTEYLEHALPEHRFSIVSLDYDQVDAAVAQQQIEFLLVNPALYVEMEGRYGVSAMLTLDRQITKEQSSTFYASTIIVRDEHANVQSITDLKEHTLAAVDKDSFGGWAMAWRQMQANGIDPFVDFSKLEFLGSHEAVVEAVLKGWVDAGVVRTGTLEKLARQTHVHIDVEALRVLPEQGDIEHSPFEYLLQHSTAYYPDWPLATLAHVDRNLVKQVAKALLALNPSDSAAKQIGIAGWAPPESYETVHELMKALRIAQYEHYGDIDLLEAGRQHWHWLMLVSVVMLFLLALAFFVTRLNQVMRTEMAERLKAQNELKLKSESLEESSQRLSAIVENVLEAVVSIDFKGTIQTFNRAAEKMFGYQQDEALGKKVGLLMPAMHANMHDQYVQNYILTGEAKIIGIGREIHGRRKDGQLFPMEAAISEVSVRGERMFIGIMHDISERLAYEQRQRQVEKLDALSKMAGGFAHEFNNLLSSIVGYTDMLLLDADSYPKIAPDLHKVMDASNRAKLLVKQLVDFSRSDYEEVLVFMPHKVVDEAVELLEGMMPAEAIIESDLDEEVGQLRLSPLQFQQLILNLGSYAIEAIAPGGRMSVSLKSTCIDSPQVMTIGQLVHGDYVVLTLSYDGKGIEADAIETVFEPAFTAHDSVKEQVMGLAAVNGIISRNNGAIDVESNAGQGTSFAVYLPCAG